MSASIDGDQNLVHVVWPWRKKATGNLGILEAMSISHWLSLVNSWGWFSGPDEAVAGPKTDVRDRRRPETRNACAARVPDARINDTKGIGRQ